MEEYKQILLLLEKEFGWKLSNSLSDQGKKLVWDTLNAQTFVKLKPQTRFQKFLFKNFFNK